MKKETKIILDGMDLEGLKLESYQINVNCEGTRYIIEGFIPAQHLAKKKKATK